MEPSLPVSLDGESNRGSIGCGGSGEICSRIDEIHRNRSGSLEIRLKSPAYPSTKSAGGVADERPRCKEKH
jgi:hypothetical protein